MLAIRCAAGLVLGVVGLRLGQSRNEASEIRIRCASDERDLNLVSRLLEHGRLMSDAHHFAIHAVDADTCFFGETECSHGSGEACVPRSRRGRQDVRDGDALDQRARRRDGQTGRRMLDSGGTGQSIIAVDDGVGYGFADGRFW